MARNCPFRVWECLFRVLDFPLSGCGSALPGCESAHSGSRSVLSGYGCVLSVCGSTFLGKVKKRCFQWKSRDQIYLFKSHNLFLNVCIESQLLAKK